MYRVTTLAFALSFFTAPGAWSTEAAQDAGAAPEDAMAALPFQEGDLLGFDQVDRLEGYLPPAFWEHREFFFYEGMQVEIGPAYREYGESEAYRKVTRENRGRASIGPDGSLAGYSGGRPFPTAEIDCESDPDAAIKIIWNFNKAWNGDGEAGSFRYTSWDRGEQTPISFEGTSKVVQLKDRVEPKYREDEGSPGDVFEDETRAHVLGIELEAPYRLRGMRILKYRWDSADGPLGAARNDDTQVYFPGMQRVRKISTAQRMCSIEGENVTIDDLRGFGGIPPRYGWECLGEVDVLAPFNTKHLAYPYRDDYDFGPYGLSYANDRWELRKAWVVRMDPKDDFHPYHHKDLYLDKETYEPLYSFAYDRREELWKIIWHNHRYSEDWDAATPERTDTRSPNGVWYAGWEGVEEPKDLRTVSDIVVNVQQGTGNRLEYWDAHGMPFESEGKLRQYLDLGRLSKGH